MITDFVPPERIIKVIQQQLCNGNEAIHTTLGTRQITEVSNSTKQ